MKTKPLILIILSQILLLSGIFIIVNVLQTQDDLTPETTKALTTSDKLATVGDSISVGSPTTSGFSYYYPGLMKSEYGVTISDSYAEGSAQTGSYVGPPKGMRLQFSDSVAGKEYTALMIMGGVNDLASNRGAQYVKDNLDWIYSQAQSNGMKVIAISILPWGCSSYSSPEKMAMTKEINAWIKTNSKVDYFIDAYEEFNQGNDCLRDIYGGNNDTVHPNAAGHKKLAEMINNKAFQGSEETMQCGEVGCSANGDDAACGWPDSGIECKSAYNDGEGRCEIVCPSNKVKTGPCECSDPTPIPTNTSAPTTAAPTTVAPTTAAPTTAAPTSIVPTRSYAPITTRTPTTITPTSNVNTTTIPRTALNDNQIMTIIIGAALTLFGIYLKFVLKENIRKN